MFATQTHSHCTTPKKFKQNIYLAHSTTLPMQVLRQTRSNVGSYQRCSARGVLTRRTSVVAHSRRGHADAKGKNPCGVFQLYPNDNITLMDVEDAIEACDVHGQTPEQRRRCMEAFGLDATMVDKYYKPVMQMEQRLIDHDDETGRRVAGAGSMLFVIFVAKKLMGA